MSTQEFSAKLKLLDNYLFEIDFGDAGSIMADEPEPLGQGEGPSPSQLLAASVANCLAASLMFAIRKFKGEPGEVTAQVNGNLSREGGRLRIEKIDVQLKLGNASIELPKIEKVLEQFQDFCIVTQSVKSGIEVNVTVQDSNGTVLKTG